MKLEHILLGLIGEMPRTGYDIKKFLDFQGRFLRSNTTMSQVYRSLTSMSEKGWIEFSVDERPGAQDAKIYRITPGGTRVFMDWLAGPYAPPTRYQDPEFSARLTFAGYLSREQVVALIETELEARKAQVRKYRFRDLSFESSSSHFDHDLAQAMNERRHVHGTQHIDLHISQLEELRQDLLSGHFGPPGAARD